MKAMKIIGTSSLYDTLQEKLNTHPINSAIHNKYDLRIFMEHHIYAVWDFMCLLKALQALIAPSGSPWMPPQNARHANFINQLILEEESDRAFADAPGSSHISHFESYRQAMAEVGANTHGISQFIRTVADNGLETALHTVDIPAPSRQFMAFTFDIINRNKPHLLAACLAYGREILVPGLFRSIHKKLQLRQLDSPGLYVYLERHIQLDEQEHGPIAILMAHELCGDSSEKRSEAVVVAEQALAARLAYWDGIHRAIVA